MQRSDSSVQHGGGMNIRKVTSHALIHSIMKLLDSPNYMTYNFVEGF